MIAPATQRERLILAAAVAFTLDLLLGVLIWRLLPPGWRVLELHGNSLIQPAHCLAGAFSLLLGGWIGGRRFLPLGVALMFALQLLALGLLVQLADRHMPQRPLWLTIQDVLASNVLGVGLQLLAAALGALAGAALHARRPLFPSPQEPT
ncbi:hypothetical protein [Pseudoxanthomonas winnipegensis]|uniref:Uncharacterized protein n=1 Tax=Pseudoxanthomonas winnipegensis TaxID=2480810 RepID=A0A4Q8L7M9_9GAMM|nr:hypothetical protein [Pseudoxanthomonas winnipegensis]RZZ81290.1 hypothetical protein EA662_18260 [Pseudoxanthomonas winnipegensis]TAA24148.1 hypothetical protein EA661_19400 [Pseudoxanthomonas winnipegensis]TAA36840.1 hypothetical protein EAT51_18790 [Pseudoxanthomonas winnipegensis]TBV74838.1 hypothetical protein EYC46_11275 [Pseudoxanthomonas winnipegensis]